MVLYQSVKDDNFQEIQKIIPIIIDDFKSKKQDFTQQEIQKIKTLKYINTSAILNEGNYFYKEKEKSQEAIKYIEDMTLLDPDFVDPFYSNYYL
jgi:hypothetical protein